MRHKSLANMDCSVARSLERIGEWWTVLILRDAIDGKKRFQEFEVSLGITPNILSRRLDGLVEDGIMERREYCARPTRYEYILTDRGKSFYRVLAALRKWDTESFGGSPRKSGAIRELSRASEQKQSHVRRKSST
jgi:DNA-binding HxlR family transcriptional regulator